MKSGNFNLLEPSGPLQACNGTALPLRFYYQYIGLNVWGLFLWHSIKCIECSEQDMRHMFCTQIAHLLFLNINTWLWTHGLYIVCTVKRNVLNTLISLEAIRVNKNSYFTKFTYFLCYNKILLIMYYNC